MSENEVQGTEEVVEAPVVEETVAEVEEEI
jgi:hypothetical protein